MRAVTFRRFGPPHVLELCSVDTPAPRNHEVRIRVHATTVTAAECAMRRGEPRWGRFVIGFTKPRRRFRVLGNELAGEIDAVGDQVTRFVVGDEVFGFAGFNPGANADYICLPEKASLVAKPVNKSYEESAAAVDGATTALHFLRGIADIQPAHAVLVIGASGSIGTYAIQLAKHFGAHVTGVCSAVNVDLVSSLGADEVIDYTTEDFTTRPETYDIIFDTIGKSSFAACKSSLEPAGIFLPTVITTGNLLQRFWTPIGGGKHVRGGMSFEKTEELNFVKKLLEANELRVVVDRSYPLEQIIDAHRHVDGGHKKGNVVITVDHQHGDTAHADVAERTPSHATASTKPSVATRTARPVLRLRDLAAVGADYATTGPNHRTVRRAFLASADELFRRLTNERAIKEWQGIDVEWTSEPPFGLGTTRIVRGLGQTIEECVLAWEPGKRMCFRYDRATLPLAACAEDYTITPTSTSTCELSWHFAYEWAGPATRVFGRLFGTAFAVGARRDLEKLATVIQAADSGSDSQRASTPESSRTTTDGIEGPPHTTHRSGRP